MWPEIDQTIVDTGLKVDIYKAEGDGFDMMWKRIREPALAKTTALYNTVTFDVCLHLL